MDHLARKQTFILFYFNFFTTIQQIQSNIMNKSTLHSYKKRKKKRNGVARERSFVPNPGSYYPYNMIKMTCTVTINRLEYVYNKASQVYETSLKKYSLVI